MRVAEKPPFREAVGQPFLKQRQLFEGVRVTFQPGFSLASEHGRRGTEVTADHPTEGTNTFFGMCNPPFKDTCRYYTSFFELQAALPTVGRYRKLRFSENLWKMGGTRLELVTSTV
jgi:hypothetical protein